jgi:hypothetical protein
MFKAPMTRVAQKAEGGQKYDQRGRRERNLRENQVSEVKRDRKSKGNQKRLSALKIASMLEVKGRVEVKWDIGEEDMPRSVFGIRPVFVAFCSQTVHPRHVIERTSMPLANMLRPQTTAVIVLLCLSLSIVSPPDKITAYPRGPVLRTHGS